MMKLNHTLSYASLLLCLLVLCTCGEGNGADVFSKVTALELIGETSAHGLLEVEFEMEETGVDYPAIPGSGPHALVSVDRGLLLEPETFINPAQLADSLSVREGGTLFWLLPAGAGPARITVFAADGSEEREIEVLPLSDESASLNLSLSPSLHNGAVSAPISIEASAQSPVPSFGPRDSEGRPLVSYHVFTGRLGSEEPPAGQFGPTRLESAEAVEWLPFLPGDEGFIDSGQLLVLASWGPLNAAQVLNVQREQP